LYTFIFGKGMYAHYISTKDTIRLQKNRVNRELSSMNSQILPRPHHPFSDPVIKSSYAKNPTPITKPPTTISSKPSRFSIITHLTLHIRRDQTKESPSQELDHMETA
jgi:hypothetical protein